jgi:flavocytochrome c
MSTTAIPQTIVIGGGLAGLSAAHTVLEQGGSVVVLEKMAFCGGNSTKATSGINGANTRTQRSKNIIDSPELFIADTVKGGANNLPLVKVLCEESGPAVDWLMDKFQLDLSLLARLGGHSQARTHRGKQKFPGMVITYAQIEKFEDLCAKIPDRAKLLTKTRATRLLTKPSSDGSPSGKGQKLYGSVIIATGGFGYDFDGLIKKYRPDLMHLPSTNGEHTTGDGIKMSIDIGAGTVDLPWIQVHPTGLVNPSEPDSKWKFLAAEALRGVGGIILDKEGNRIANELGRRDYVTGRMWEEKKAPYRLILNSKASAEIEWHCKHYKGRGLMKQLNGSELATEMGVNINKLKDTFAAYTEVAKKVTEKPNEGPYEAYPSGKTFDKFGKKYFTNFEFTVNDSFHVAIITPVIHYTMGGIKVDDNARVISETGTKPLKFLYGAGEVNGGIHGENRLGGSSLLDCVVYGRVAGRTAVRELTQRNLEVMKKMSKL